MATAKKNVQVVEKNTGTKIDWKQSGNKLIFGDDDLSIRCDTRQRDWPVQVDICADEDRNLVIGAAIMWLRWKSRPSPMSKLRSRPQRVRMPLAARWTARTAAASSVRHCRWI